MIHELIKIHLTVRAVNERYGKPYTIKWILNKLEIKTGYQLISNLYKNKIL